MHPVFLQGPAAEHIKAMTAAAGRDPVGPAGTPRQAAKGRRPYPPCPLPVRPGALRSCVIVSWLEGNAHAAGNR